MRSAAESRSTIIPQTDLQFCATCRDWQIALALLWGELMHFFVRQIVLGEPDGPCIDKIATHTARPHGSG